MGSKKELYIEKWIDLDRLPRFNGAHGNIDWNRSIGYSVPFKYGDVTGEIQILGHKRQNKQGYILVFIDKYMREPHYVQVTFFHNCGLAKFCKNRMIDVAPELVEYLINPDEAYLVNIFSRQKLKMKCPICGCEKEISPCKLYRSGFACKICSDGVSYPNKFLTNALQQAGLTFQREVTRKTVGFEWAKSYRYDFAMIIDNHKYIVEMDGGLHKYQRDRDKIKTDLAIKNGYNLIRINGDYGYHDRFSFLRQAILDSELAQLVNFNDVDWEICNMFALKNLTKLACDLWENQCLSVGEIVEQIGMSRCAIKSYLKIGKQVGLCPSYNKKESRERRSILMGKPVAFVKDGEIVHVFPYARNVETLSMQLFGVQCTKNGVLAVCKKDQKTHRGLEFKHITKKEYEQYKMINNNEVVLKGAI